MRISISPHRWCMHLDRHMLKIVRIVSPVLKCLKNIARICWNHRVSNIEVRRKVLGNDGKSVDMVVNLHRLRWLGHVLRMPEHRLRRCAILASVGDGWKKLEYQNRLTGLSTSCAPSPRTVARSSSSSLLRKGGRNTYNRYHANGSNNNAGINSSDEGFDRLFYKPRRSQPVVHPASEIPFCE
ncbi:unnamed protein product, partial [Schistosoma curassoni]|uniref:Uncharacterized protein n=1 Tax=Schistosoma curassoni TaxID=6186 RepID=A0A183JG01_9TREM